MANILLIDDNELVRENLSEILADAGHGVEEAPDGAVGIEKGVRGKFDVVISDIFMPGEDGIGAIRKIRGENPDIGIIAISGGGQAGGAADVLRMSAELGADFTLSKPISRTVLLATVAEATRKHSRQLLPGFRRVVKRRVI